MPQHARQRTLTDTGQVALDIDNQFISLSYQLTDTVRLEVQGINITDEATKGYTMDPSFPNMYEKSGSRLTVGVRVQF